MIAKKITRPFRMHANAAKHVSAATTAGLLCASAIAALAQPTPHANAEWPAYGGNPAGDHYSELKQITPQNVAKLHEVWRFDTETGGLQASPLVVDGTLFAPTPEQGVLALDPATGKPKWRYFPTDAAYQPVRGLAYWRNGADRALFTSHASKLTALDPATGAPIQTFGTHGEIDLREGLGRDPKGLAVYLTTPGSIFEDLIIVGFRTGETRDAAPGAVRAYDVRTGHLRWTFNLVSAAGNQDSSSWPAGAQQTAGGANNWAGMVVDDKRGIVYVPTGSAVDDFYGADRKGDNLYANSLVALDARTGKRLWHFQMVHHDIWDRDLASPPVLLTVRSSGKLVDAVAQATKQGTIFLFDRVTGTPLFPIEERPVPASDVPGEHAWPTQPFPLKPAPLTRQVLTADMLTTRTPEAAAAARSAFARLNNKGPYTPLTVDKQTLVFPGFNGGVEWGGGAVDRASGVFYVNAMDVAWTGALTRAIPGKENAGGERLYQQHCAACHGLDRKGSPPEFPSLVGVVGRRSEIALVKTVLGGKGRMPGFPQISGPELGALFGYLGAVGTLGGKEDATAPVQSTQSAKYIFTGYRKFLDPDGYPAVAPPWGTLSAIDMNTGEFLWKIPLGHYPELAARGMSTTGTENYGGPIVTATGLLFIGATIYDRQFRAFDAPTGRLLWSTGLPYAGTATPITYSIGGRQFVVIATSGDRDPKGPQGAAYVAFALPEQGQ